MRPKISLYCMNCGFKNEVTSFEIEGHYICSKECREELQYKYACLICEVEYKRYEFEEYMRKRWLEKNWHHTPEKISE